MQFSKLLPTLCAVVGVCTWSFMAAQEESPEARVPLPGLRANATPLEIQYDDSMVDEEAHVAVPLPRQTAISRAPKIVRVAARQTDAEADVAQAAAVESTAPSVPATPTGVTVRQRPASGSKTPGIEIEKPSKYTRVTLEVGFADPLLKAEVMQVSLRIKYTDTSKGETFVNVRPNEWTFSPNLISIDQNFDAFLNSGELQVSAAVTTKDGTSPFSPFKTVEFQELPLPAIRINKVDAFKPAGDDSNPQTISPSALLTNRSRFKFDLQIDNPTSGPIVAVLQGKAAIVQLLNGGTLIEEKSLTPFATSALAGTVEFDLGEKYSGPLQFRVCYRPAADDIKIYSIGLSNPSPPVTVNIDKTPPRFIDARLITENQLEIRFREPDLAASAKVANNYTLAIAGSTGTAPTISADGEIRGSSVLFFLTSISTGSFTIAPKAGLVTDLAGNAMVTGDLTSFNSAPDRERGAHVEFPEFVDRATVRDATRVFNPGDKVETRVARLYYYRDAHRVAEIINRNVRSFNRAAVKVTEQEAERARDQAERLTGERKASERQAIFDAQQTRVIERDIQQKERELAALQADRIRQNQRVADADKAVAQAQAVHDILAARKSAAAANPAATAPAPVADGAAPTPQPVSPDAELAANLQLTAAQAQQTQASAKLEAIDTSIQTANTVLTQLSSTATASRNSEFQSREKVATTEFDEDRARASQFRKEVAAATSDPDTYVPAVVDSLDPVTQVSISVIGEGLIQLRGPIRGINTIREMISQIDTPVGQVKVGIHTVQINGEHGDRMESVASRIEASLKLGQTLTSQSLMLLRRAIQEVAAETVDAVNGQGGNGRRQVDRDRRYLYQFFGQDFTDELYEMDSEFLRSENKLLGLHSMDTLSIAQAMFIMALAKNDVRQMILERFRHLVRCELPEAEWDHRRTTKLLPKKFNTLQEVILNANARYHFRNLHSFVNAPVNSPNTMTPMQREFIRLAQIFKSQMIAEMEYKQRVMERGLIEDRSNSEDALHEALRGPHQNAINLVGEHFGAAVNAAGKAQKVWDEPNVQAAIFAMRHFPTTNAIRKNAQSANQIAFQLKRAVELDFKDVDDINSVLADLEINGSLEDGRLKQSFVGLLKNERFKELIAKELHFDPLTDPTSFSAAMALFLADVNNSAYIFSDELVDELNRRIAPLSRNRPLTLADQDAIRLRGVDSIQPLGGISAVFRMNAVVRDIVKEVDVELKDWYLVNNGFARFRELIEDPATPMEKVQSEYDNLQPALKRVIDRLDGRSKQKQDIRQQMVFLSDAIRVAFELVRTREVSIKAALALEKRTRGDLDHRKIMEFHIDEQAEKMVDLAEGTRSHIAQIDNYLKRMFISLEDDFQAQFYDPAFEDVRRASRMWDVNLAQVERTTVLGNNRTLMKVSPQATMEFDLPKRHTAIFEGMAVAKAAYQDYGALVTDPNFLALSKMASGSPAVGGDPRSIGPGGTFRDTLQNPSVKNVLPGMGSSADEQMFSQVAGNKTQFGSALEGLIPDPAVFKFETGTGFEIRPVMQPDGSSLVFDFDYMYTTNVREPIRADEKHLGRVKRHFIRTQVQTTSFELREISRYLVALKASRTSRGIPLLEDVPGIGGLFRPLPSAESSLQQNIILSQSMAYPTLFDLMGLRWSKHVVDLDHAMLRDSEHVVRGRYQTVRDFTFDESAKNFDEFLDIKNRQPDHLRTDLYHRQAKPSPYHPGGYHNPGVRDEEDPTGRRFTIPDTRPVEMQDPYYDPKFRRPVEVEQVGPGQSFTPQSVGPGERIIIPAPNPAPGPAAMRTSPRGSRPQQNLPELILPDQAGTTDHQFLPPRDTVNPEQVLETTPADGMPTGYKRARGQKAIQTVSTNSSASVKRVVNDQSATVHGKVEKYRVIEPRFLPPAETKKGIPSLKQLISGGKSAITPKSWSNGKAPSPATTAATSTRNWPKSKSN
jgi:hypothetical protein